MFSTHVVTLAQSERIAQVLHSLAAVKLGLSTGIAAALDAAQNRQPHPFGERFGQSVSLVESPLSQSGRVKRYRDQAIHGICLNSCVLDGFGKVFREDAAQIKFSPVFEAMDQISQDTFCLVVGDRTGKSRRAIFAIRTAEFSRDDALERSGATLAEWGLNAGQGLPALIAEKGSHVLRLPTPDTVGGVEQLQHRIKQDPNWIPHVGK
jgi:hypothetical protein